MSSIAMIYFARLSLVALVYQEELPKEFQAYRIPNWWRFYRHVGETEGVFRAEVMHAVNEGRVRGKVRCLTGEGHGGISRRLVPDLKRLSSPSPRTDCGIVQCTCR